MPLSEQRLQTKIEQIQNELKDEEDGEIAKTKFAQKLAKAIVEEIKELKITATYNGQPVVIVSLE